MNTRPIVYALLSALLFGISTPAAKVLLGLSNPAILAGLLLVFPSLLEALMEIMIGRDISYTATFGLAIAVAVLLKQRMQPDIPQVQATGRH